MKINLSYDWIGVKHANPPKSAALPARRHKPTPFPQNNYTYHQQTPP
jgi:hypothetical protein